MSDLHMVVPAEFDDPAQPSGGNVYDCRISAGLAELGWHVHHHRVSGSWPWPDADAASAVRLALSQVPDGSLVLVDGLVGLALPDVLVPASRRVRLVVLVHMPLIAMPAGRPEELHARESAVLHAAAAVITTGSWTRLCLIDHYRLSPELVHVAHPGADPANPVTGDPEGGRLLCVAAVSGAKGHDTLVTALARIDHLPWQCTCVGPLDRDGDFVDRLRRRMDLQGISSRVHLTGPLIGAALTAAYDSADLLVLASRSESYGMVLGEALAHALPVVASDVGGVREAIGAAPDGTLPGVLVRPGDSVELAVALSRWLQEAPLRNLLRRAALERRASLPNWRSTTERVAHALAGVPG